MQKEIDRGQFERLVTMGFGRDGLTFFFRCSDDELDDWCRRTYRETIEEIQDEIMFAQNINQDKDKPYSVYAHVSPSGKMYIGITKCKLKDRWRNGAGYWSNSHFSSAIKKYGWENIKHAILFMRLTKEEAEQKEREMISKFRTTDRTRGYNIESGGSLNKVVSQETREKLRKRSTGRTASDETRRKMSIAHKGQNCHFYGKPVTDERKAELSRMRSKPVMQLDMDGNIINEYPSMKEAARIFGVTRQAISYCCSGGSKSCAGYVWRWKNGSSS